MKLYKLENIKRTHGSRTVLSIDDLEVAPGKIYTLIGPNGAGKTSLLKILSFLDLPSEGSMYFMGEKVERAEGHLQKIRKRVVLLDQSPIMFTGSVWKNIEFGLKIRGIDARQKSQRIHDALALVGLERFKDYNARGLSGGETKRIALARALVLQPEVLLCDEPTANVDGENQEIILETIKTINRERNTSVIFSTHYLSQGQRLADHSLLLQHGSLSDMANENIFRITIAGVEGDRALCQLTGQLILKVPKALVPQGHALTKIHIKSGLLSYDQKNDSNMAGNEAGNVVAGHVTEIIQESGSVRLGVNIGVKLVVTVSMETYLKSKPSIGQKLEVSIPDDALGFSTYSST